MITGRLADRLLEKNITIRKKQIEVEEKTSGVISLSDIPKEVKLFMPEFQQRAIVGSEEHWTIIAELAKIISGMPKTYETSNVESDEKTVYLHYFYGSANWYIVEKDKGDPTAIADGDKQFQAFGYASLYGDFLQGEWGYISIEELKETNKVELDFYFYTN
jgi:hypothetical protein